MIDVSAVEILHFEDHGHALAEIEFETEPSQEEHSEWHIILSDTKYNAIHLNSAVHRFRSLLDLRLLDNRLDNLIKEIALSIIIIGDIPEQTLHNKIVILMVDPHQEGAQLAGDPHAWLITGPVGFLVVGRVLDQLTT